MLDQEQRNIGNKIVLGRTYLVGIFPEARAWYAPGPRLEKSTSSSGTM